MGASDSRIRIPAGIHQFPSALPVTGHNTSQRRRQKIGTHRRDHAASPKECHREGPPTASVLPVRFLPHHEEIRRVAAHTQLTASEQAHKAPSIQDGIPGSSASRTQERLVGSHLGLEGRLLTHSYRSFRQEMAGFLHRRADIQIQEPAVRTLHGPQNVHPSCESDSGVPPKKRDLRLHIPGRLVANSSVRRCSKTEYPDYQALSSITRFHHQRGKVSTRAITTHTVPRGPSGLQDRDGVSNAGKGPGNYRMCQAHPEGTSSSGPSLDASVRIDGQPHSNSPSVSSPHEDHPASCPLQVPKPQTPVVSSDPNNKQSQKGSIMVDAAIQHSSRQEVFPAPYIIHLDHRCVQDWMGCPLEGHPSLRHLAPVLGQAPHQSPGTVGHPHCPTSSPQTSQWAVCLGEMRQHVRGDVSKQDGRCAEPIPVPPDGPPSALVQQSQDLHSSSPPPGSRQHLGRQLVEERDSHQRSSQDPRLISGLAPEQDSMPHPVQQSRTTPDRSLCGQQEQSASNLLQLGKGPEGLRTRCDVDQLEHGTRVCLPSDRPHPSGPGEALQVKELPTNPDHAQMASPDMVHKASDNGSRRSDSSSPPERSHPDPRGRSSTSSDSQDSEPDSMATFVKSYTQAGLSREAATIAGEARRPSTRRTYNTRLRKYYRWCRRNQVAPHSATLGEVCEFLTWVFTHEGASLNSIRACRTAVGAVHHGFPGGTSVSSSTVIQDLIKGMFHKRPPSKSLVPAWDLPRALRLLAEPPFEPLDQASLLDLSRKTAFLVAAACGRRVSEIHALSTAENHLEFRASAVHLLPRAGFLAKNQTMDFTPKHIVLPDLRKASKSPDCKAWCPVRALKFYLHRTKPYRGEVDRLFLTTSKPVRVASKQTLSRWIISVIKDSISTEECRLTGSHVRAHDLRSQTAAWALYKGSSIQDIMEAQGWSSSSTFQSVYLKDVLIPRAESASRVLSTASSSSAAKDRQ